MISSAVPPGQHVVAPEVRVRVRPCVPGTTMACWPATNGVPSTNTPRASYVLFTYAVGEEVFETLGLNVKECTEWVEHAPLMIQFRSHLFSRIVPIVKDIGLWGPKVQKAFTDMGVHDMAGFDIDGMMKADEDQAEDLDRAHAEMAGRVAEVDAAIAAGAS